MSVVQSQQLLPQGRTSELPTSSKKQPSSSPQKRPVGIETGLAALVLAALTFSLILCYAAECTIAARDGYEAMSVQREIEDLRAQNALLRYQINVAHSNQRLEHAAVGLSMRPADAVREVDYVLLPHPDPGDAVQVAEGDPSRDPGALEAALTGFAAEVAGSFGGRAEASTE